MGTTEQLSEAERAVRAGAGLVDRSARGKLALSGGETKRFLQGQITNDVVALQPGEGLYAAFLTAKGKMLGDLRVLDSGDELLLDTERVALQELFNMVRRYSLGFDVELHRRTLERGLLSLVGPQARALLGDAAAGLGEDEHAHLAATVEGIPVRLIATDVGVDLLVDSAQTEALAQALVARGALPVEEETAATLRVETARQPAR
ncbi:MAG TPA: folate-binding protein, partial [Conexibacter sp.]|nr:folate-binding protein [Conexibacter sp.]